jgi:hypothetical protein
MSDLFTERLVPTSPASGIGIEQPRRDPKQGNRRRQPAEQQETVELEGPSHQLDSIA